MFAAKLLAHSSEKMSCIFALTIGMIFASGRCKEQQPSSIEQIMSGGVSGKKRRK